MYGQPQRSLVTEKLNAQFGFTAHRLSHKHMNFRTSKIMGDLEWICTCGLRLFEAFRSCKVDEEELANLQRTEADKFCSNVTRGFSVSKLQRLLAPRITE